MYKDKSNIFASRCFKHVFQNKIKSLGLTSFWINFFCFIQWKKNFIPFNIYCSKNLFYKYLEPEKLPIEYFQ